MKREVRQILNGIDTKTLIEFADRVASVPETTDRDEIERILDSNYKDRLESACSPLYGIHRVILEATIEELEAGQNLANDGLNDTLASLEVIRGSLESMSSTLDDQVNDLRSQFTEIKSELRSAEKELHKKMPFSLAGTIMGLIATSVVILSLFGGASIFTAQKQLGDAESEFDKLRKSMDSKNTALQESLDRYKENLEAFRQQQAYLASTYNSYFISTVIADYRQLLAKFSLTILEDFDYEAIRAHKEALERFRHVIEDDDNATLLVVDLLDKISKAFLDCESINLNGPSRSNLLKARRAWEDILADVSDVANSIDEYNLENSQVDSLVSRLGAYCHNIVGVISLKLYRAKIELQTDSNPVSDARDRFINAVSEDPEFGRPYSNLAIVSKYELLDEINSLRNDDTTRDIANVTAIWSLETLGDYETMALSAIEENCSNLLESASNQLSTAAELAQAPNNVVTAYNNLADFHLLHARLCLAMIESAEGSVDMDWRDNLMKKSQHLLDQATTYINIAKGSGTTDAIPFTEAEVLAARVKLAFLEEDIEPGGILRIRAEIIGLVESSRLAGLAWEELELAEYLHLETEFRFISLALEESQETLYQELMIAAGFE